MVSIGAGYTGRKEGRVLCVENAWRIEKNVESCTNLVEKNRNGDLISGIFTAFQGESRYASCFGQNPVKKFILKNNPADFFLIFRPMDPSRALFFPMVQINLVVHVCCATEV